MDQKYFEEIKARCVATIPEIAAPVFKDRAALLAEVERLAEENNEQDNAHHKLFMIYCEQQKQIATLKKALELACKELNLSPVEKVFAPNYFIHQAQEPSCHTCQKQSGCQHRRFETNDYEPCDEYEAQEQEEKNDQ